MKRSLFLTALLALAACATEPMPKGLHCHSAVLNQNYYYATGTYGIKGDALQVPVNKPMPQGKGIRCYEKH